MDWEPTYEDSTFPKIESIERAENKGTELRISLKDWKENDDERLFWTPV